VYLFGWDGLVPSRINSVHGLQQTGFVQRSSKPRIGWELAPNVDSFFKLVPFRTNSRGLRDREYSLEKPEGTFRVAVVGASFALPAGVAIEDAFHSLLETRLSQGQGGRSYEFLNFAVGMYNPEQVLATLELRALDYDPDLILFVTTRLSEPLILDVPGSRLKKSKKGEVAPPVFQKSYPILQSFLLRLLRFRLNVAVSAQAPVGILERGYMRVAARLSPAARPLDLTRTEPPARTPRLPVIDRLGRLHVRTGIPVVIVRLEFDTRSKRRWARRTPKNFPARCRALALHCHDTRDAFEGTDARSFWIHPLDPHPNGAAHERFAGSIASFLLDRALLPAPAPGT
jgi:hypothetical protein